MDMSYSLCNHCTIYCNSSLNEAHVVTMVKKCLHFYELLQEYLYTPIQKGNYGNSANMSMNIP